MRVGTVPAGRDAELGAGAAGVGAAPSAVSGAGLFLAVPSAAGTDRKWPAAAAPDGNGHQAFRDDVSSWVSRQRDWTPCAPASGRFALQHSLARRAQPFVPEGNRRVDTPLSSVPLCTGFGARAHTLLGTLVGPASQPHLRCSRQTWRGHRRASGQGHRLVSKIPPPPPAVAAPLRATDALRSPRLALGVSDGSRVCGRAEG